MTEGRCTAFLFSFLLHGIIVAAVWTTPFFDARKETSIAVNLTFVTPTGNGRADTGERPKGQVRSGKKEDTSRFGSQEVVRNPELTSRQDVGRKNETDHTDTSPAGYSGRPVGHRNVSSASPGSGSGDVKELNYSGSGGVDERHFSFIRDTIMQGIVYPEHARRRGWEGKVVLSFTVRENGSIDDIKVVTSSGFPVLDENARGTIARTSFRKKVPVRLYVLLPVEYKLR
jgi:TonB family protein